MWMRKMLIGVAVLVAVLGSACASSVDTSKARSRSVIESGEIVSAEELRVAEYLGYYKQSFPSPVNATLGLDLRLGNMQVPAEGGPAWLQIGVQARAAEAEVVAPLNLAIVIDRSGSMDTPEKMPYLKQSLRVFLRSLATNDVVALVAFDNRAEVIATATRVGDGKWIDAAVDRLQPAGSTNLHDGLMLGFKEVDRNYDVRRNNRVILLTDGVANVGVTEPEQIAAAARAYNDRGIYLSTIGLGRQEFNDALLIRLANQGKGAYHFVDSAAEMDKVFRKEVTGLFQKAASDVVLVLRPEPSVGVESLTGYEGRPPSGAVQIRLRDMGTGDNQLVLARLDVASGSSGRRPIAAVELRYQDLFSKREASAIQSVVANAGRLGSYDPAWDAEMLRNVTIQRTAEGLKEIDRLYRGQRYLEAWQLAQDMEQDLRRVARLANDPQLVKDAEMMRKYQDTLSKWVQKQTGRAPQAREGSSDQPVRGRSSDSSGDGPTLDIQ